MSTSREVDNETMAGVTFCFAVVTGQEVLQMFTFLERVVLSPSLDTQIQLLFSHDGECSATINLDFRE